MLQKTVNLKSVSEKLDFSLIAGAYGSEKERSAVGISDGQILQPGDFEKLAMIGLLT